MLISIFNMMFIPIIQTVVSKYTKLSCIQQNFNKSLNSYKGIKKSQTKITSTQCHGL